MAEANKPETTRFNQTIPVQLYERLKAAAARKAPQGKQLKIQKLVEQAILEFVEKNESL